MQIYTYLFLLGQTNTAATLKDSQAFESSRILRDIQGHAASQAVWRYSINKRNYNLSTKNCSIYFPKAQPQRPSAVFFEIGRHYLKRPAQGNKFKTLSDWEKHAFSLVSKVWNDTDGYVLETQIMGERKSIVQGVKTWDTLSNTVSIIWMTHPVRKLQRQFSCMMDAASGKPISMTCSSFIYADPRRKAEFDNSKLRRTKVSQPPPGIQGVPPTIGARSKPIKP